jgi:hypothetical protein
VDLSEDGTTLDVNLCNDRCSYTYVHGIARVDHCDLDELKVELDKRNIGYCF